MGGASCHPAQIDLSPKDQFVAGGWNRGAALAHLRLSEAGEVECSGGVLGESFNDYLKTLPPAELHRVYLDYTEGIDAWQHVNEDARSILRPEDPDGLEQRRHRKIDKSEAWNSATVADNLEEVCEKVTEAIACGAVRVLGTVEEVRARGALPLHLNPLTVETSKLRLCVNQRKLNLMSEWPKVELDGLQSIEDDVRGRAVHGAVADEASGYQHHRLSEDSQDLFGVVFLGHVLVYTVLTFGWGPSCHYHQGHGMIPVGYHRSLGGLVELYIDDHTLVGRDGADQASVERDVYGFYTLKGEFGYYLSPSKTMKVVSQVFRTLGLQCDTVRQVWTVPEDKRVEYRAIARTLSDQLAVGPPDPWALSRFAGKTVYYRRACETLRYHQNLQYAVLSNRKLHREAPPTDHRWWLTHREGARPLSSKLRKLLAAEIAACVALVAADQVHTFVSDEHTVLVDQGGHITLYTDTTLHTFGAVIREDEPIARPDKVFGGVMPEEVAGVYIAKCNTGVVELSGLVYACRIIDHNPDMLERVKNRLLDVHMDNFEDVRLLQTGRVRGEYTVEKQQLLLEFQHYMWKWNTRERVYYVNTLVNPADEPSRQGFKGETRLMSSVFRSLWATAGGFDLDAMASCANRQSDPTGQPLPFISLGPDPESRSMNFFGKDHGRGLDGHRERLYVNPPFVMQRSVIQWLKRCRAAGVVLVKNYAPPWPAWLVELSRYTTRSWVLRAPHSEVRTGDGFVPLSAGVELLACEFDFELPSRIAPVAVGELPATLG